jgi:4-aminobutyrate aminotransferase-like enzyme
MENETIVAKVVQRCLDRGVITFWFLSHPNSFRLSPPLNMTFEEIKTSTAIICEAIQSV